MLNVSKLIVKLFFEYDLCNKVLACLTGVSKMLAKLTNIAYNALSFF